MYILYQRLRDEVKLRKNRAPDFRWDGGRMGLQGFYVVLIPTCYRIVETIYIFT
jgi:hypothetical protein